MRFRGINHGHAGREQQPHRGEQRPALTLVSDHPAEGVGQRSADREDQQHLDETGEGRRVLEGMRGIRVEKTAAIRAQHLDRELRGNRSAGDGLGAAFEGCRADRAVEGLRHSLPHQEQGRNQRDRQQHIQGRPGQIDPEVPDRFGTSAGKAADQGDRDRNAGRSRQKHLDRDPHHLCEIAERALAAIGLPARVGDKADRGVEREVGADRSQALRVQRQQILQPLQYIKDDHARQIERQQRQGVSKPALLGAPVDPGEPVDAALDRLQHGREEHALAGKEARHIAAERRHQRDDERRERNNLQPAQFCHRSAPSELPPGSIRPRQARAKAPAAKNAATTSASINRSAIGRVVSSQLWSHLN